MKKTYYVTMTYINTIEAESFEDAEKRTEEMIRNGDIIPNDIETEIAKEYIFAEEEIQYHYEYNDKKFEFQEDVIDALVDDNEIDMFSIWLNNNYTAYEMYNNIFEDLEPQYKEYQKDMLITCIQLGTVKELK